MKMEFESRKNACIPQTLSAYQGHSSDSTNSSKLIPASQASTTTTTCMDVTTVERLQMSNFGSMIQMDIDYEKVFSFLFNYNSLFTACLKAKKSPFDFNSPSGFILA